MHEDASVRREIANRNQGLSMNRDSLLPISIWKAYANLLPSLLGHGIFGW
jgi:hypothetical protein